MAAPFWNLGAGNFVKGSCSREELRCETEIAFFVIEASEVES